MQRECECKVRAASIDEAFKKKVSSAISEQLQQLINGYRIRFGISRISCPNSRDATFDSRDTFETVVSLAEFLQVS